MRSPNRLLMSVLMHNAALALIGLGGVGVAVTIWIFALSEVLDAPAAVLLGLALLLFVGTVVLGVLTFIDAMRGNHERAGERRWPAAWCLLGGVALMFIAAAIN